MGNNISQDERDNTVIAAIMSSLMEGFAEVGDVVAAIFNADFGAAVEKLGRIFRSSYKTLQTNPILMLKFYFASCLLIGSVRSRRTILKQWTRMCEDISDINAKNQSWFSTTIDASKLIIGFILGSVGAFSAETIKAAYSPLVFTVEALNAILNSVMGLGHTAFSNFVAYLGRSPSAGPQDSLVLTDVAL
jgi:hypothetical protein